MSVSAFPGTLLGYLRPASIRNPRAFARALEDRFDHIRVGVHDGVDVVLTLIGGGVFGNPVATVWESILWAADLVAPLLQQDMCIIVNGYSLSGRISLREVCEGAQARGGTLSVFDEDSVEVFAALEPNAPIPTPSVSRR